MSLEWRGWVVTDFGGSLSLFNWLSVRQIRRRIQLIVGAMNGRDGQLAVYLP